VGAVATKRPRPESRVAKRLPRPAQPVRARCELDDSELRAVEIAATAARLSVASFLRVVAVESAAAHADPKRLAAWAEIAARLAQGTGAEPPKRPGRPKKDGGKRA